MPLYDYQCAKCDDRFELLVRSDTAVACPSCGSRKVERLLSLTARPRSPGKGPASVNASRLGPPAGGGCCGGACHGHSH